MLVRIFVNMYVQYVCYMRMNESGWLTCNGVEQPDGHRDRERCFVFVFSGLLG